MIKYRKPYSQRNYHFTNANGKVEKLPFQRITKSNASPLTL